MSLFADAGSVWMAKTTTNLHTAAAILMAAMVFTPAAINPALKKNCAIQQAWL